jgi:phosphate/sulfate permease
MSKLSSLTVFCEHATDKSITNLTLICKYVKDKSLTWINPNQLQMLFDNKLPVNDYVLLTFDDGQEYKYENISIFLRKEKIKAISFIIPLHYSYSKLAVDFEYFIKNQDVFEIGSHSLTHTQVLVHPKNTGQEYNGPRLIHRKDRTNKNLKFYYGLITKSFNNLYARMETKFEYQHRIWNEILFSKDWIERVIGKECMFFAYPWGVHNNSLVNIVVQSEYKLAFSINNVDMKATEVSRIVDKLNAYFKTDQFKVLAEKNQLSKTDYEFAKSAVDSLKPIAKNYHALGFDAMVNAMIAKASIIKPSEQLSFKLKLASVRVEDFKKNPEMKLHLTTKEDIIKVLEDSDNKTIRYFMIGGLIIFILTFIYSEKIKEPTAGRQATVFKRLQLLSSAGFSIGHGGNDAQKVMGIIAAALVANGDILDIKDMPNWVPIACYAAIGLGTLSGGWKIVKTMGTKITKVTPLEGVCAETAGATTLFLTEQMGIPVSTTHTITGAIIGVGATKRLSAVRWGVTINLLWAWILTIPVSAIVAALTYWVVSNFV